MTKECCDITLEEIKGLFNLAIEKLQRENVLKISFDKDEYWNVLGGDMNDFSKAPDPGVGSLYDDIGYLKRSLEEKQILSYSDFDRLAAVLKSISNIEAPA
ncbi:hypothetical protein JHJ32_21430 [Parapedobacter sp. ISTM3]|uniref:hypothetical protein n=1 Tax=Parapedobacter sp. ISTM3 TaxID=2800130 RepID=UPI0019086543|nr:hypothetical protein [Parapedobacter sp. ISTM3]MBK1442576.1 hypothetical protein [Parapedobacter sp. ISTM3]